MINALCHRSYDSISGSVSLAIYDDRVEIVNPGRLPNGITPDNIKTTHESKPYNPVMAGVLYRTAWLESWGSGVTRMVDACKDKNLPEPYYYIPRRFFIGQNINCGMHNVLDSSLLDLFIGSTA